MKSGSIDPHPSTVAAVRRRLTAWYAKNKRDLPWRRTKDPYVVLVSEVMLQQTQVETVLPYFAKFLERFPTAADLAAAEEEEVFRRWAGLGYYRRARNLHRAAKEVVEGRGGVFPERREDLLALPGVGPYTAGALASIAFDRAEPLVDGNVERVLARVFAVGEDLSKSAGKKRIWSLAERLVPEESPGDFNQALMELGAVVCVPLGPKCASCPLRGVCRAESAKTIELHPVKSRNGRRERIEEVVLMVCAGDSWLVADSNDEGLYRGLWQFPWKWTTPAAPARARILRELGEAFGLEAASAPCVAEVRHAVTFRSITARFHSVDLSEGRKGKERALEPHASRSGTRRVLFLDPEEILNLPMPAYQKRTFQKLSRERESRKPG